MIKYEKMNEGVRIDYLTKQIAKLNAIYKNIQNLNSNDPRLTFIHNKITKLKKEKSNWEGIYNSIGEAAVDVPPPAIHQQQYQKSNISVLNQNKLNNAYILAATLWGEARGEGEKGMRAVMNVIMNRSKNDFNKAVKVVLRPKQFSFWNNKSDQLKYSLELASKMRKSKDPQYFTALKIVDEAMRGKLKDITGGAIFYYNPKLANPSWAKKMKKTISIGNHSFLKSKPIVAKTTIQTKKKLTEIRQLIIDLFHEMV